MSDNAQPSDLVRLLAEQQGLDRALKLFPATVIAAAERGLRPLGTTAEGVSALTQPATLFDAARFGRRE